MVTPSALRAATGRRPRAAVHGWLVVNKTAGMTSTRVVSLVRRLTGAAKAGHGGTLDPLATGVLPVALGEATKTVAFVMAGVKHYRFTVRWGEARDTDDADGALAATSPVRPSRAAIEAALPRFTGEILQVPPAYSAVKVEGRRAYDLARRAETVELAPRPVRVDRLALVEVPDPDHATFEMVCGQGSYVRAFARDLGAALGTCAHVSALCRSRVGPFGLEDAIPLVALEGLADSAALAERLLPIERGLAGVPLTAVNADQAARLKNGQAVPLVRAPVDRDGLRIPAGASACALFAGRPVALVEFKGGELRPVRVFNL